MDESSEIKFLKAKVALLETEKKHLIQKITGLEKQKPEILQNTSPSHINAYVIPEEIQPVFHVEGSNKKYSY